MVNPSLQILEYSTLRPKLKTQISISNFVGTKFFRWHLRIIFFWRQLRSSLEFSHSNLIITSFWHQFGSYLGLDIPGDSSQGFLFAFHRWGLLSFSFVGNCMNGEMVKWRNKYFLVGVLLCFYFLGELHVSSDLTG